MKIFIHSGNMQTAKALQRFIQFNFAELGPDFYFGYLGDGPSINPSEWHEADMLIAEAINHLKAGDPEGWRNAKAFGKKTLVLFAFPDSCFQAREFFIATSLSKLKEKLKMVIQFVPASQKDYEKIEAVYPFLKQTPKHSHY